MSYNHYQSDDYILESCVKTSIDASIKIKQVPRSIHVMFGELQMEMETEMEIGDSKGEAEEGGRERRYMFTHYEFLQILFCHISVVLSYLHWFTFQLPSLNNFLTLPYELVCAIFILTYLGRIYYILNKVTCFSTK